jgi:replicative DNA helicase
MKVLLRSCFVSTPNDPKDFLLDNYFTLRQSGLDFDIVQDQVLWAYIQDFIRSFNHVPDVLTIRQHFEMLREDEVVKRLAHLSSIQVLVRGDFISRVNDLAEQRRTRIVSELLKEAEDIVVTGKEFREGKNSTTLRGPIAAIKHILNRSHDIVAPTLGAKLSGEITRDGVDYKNEYLRVAENPMAGIGQHTGLDQMDSALNGAKKHELWVHAAFTGHMKSTFMLNWAYNQAVWFRWNSLIFSLEMPYEQCRRILYALHSSHRKFAAVRHALGLQKDPRATIGLPYQNMRDGNLKEWHPNAEKFLLDYVIPDFNGQSVVTGNDPDTGIPWGDPSTYGKIHIEVADPDKNDFTMADLKQRAELLYSQDPFKLLFVDHAGLMAPRKWVASTTDRLNEVIRDCKRMAMSFNRGEGIPVVTLFQINREGFRAAMKMKEKGGTARYELTGLAYANECERSADIVTSSWIDETLSKANRVQFQCLKSRDQKPFEMFNARVEWPCRRLLTCTDVTMTPQQQEAVGNQLDQIKKLEE